MNWQTVLLIGLYIGLSVGGLTVFKLGCNRQFEIGIHAGKLHIGVHWLVLLGLLMYVLSFLLYMGLVSRFNLSFIAPISTGLVYIVTFLAARFVFHDTITPAHYIGAALILAGVLLIGMHSKT